MAPAIVDRRLACPRDGAPLFARGEGVACQAGHRFPRRGRAIDFRGEAAPGEAAQRDIYNGEVGHYAEGGDELRRFVRDHLAGRVKSKQEFLLRALSGLSFAPSPEVLEVGCNDGRYLSLALALWRGRGIGLDIAERALERAALSGEGEFHLASACALPIAPASMDCVLALDVYEHLGHDGFRRSLREAARVLAEGGALVAYVVSQQDRFTLHETLRRMTGGALGVDAGDGHRYEDFVASALFREAAAEAGLAIERLDPYHGFWTLFADYWLPRTPRLAYRLLERLDVHLTREGYGNGYLAIARKK